jgi:hypothetical protein
MASLHDFGGVKSRRGNRAINFTSLLADEESNLRQTEDGETVGFPPAPDTGDGTAPESPPSMGGGTGGGNIEGPGETNDPGATNPGVDDTGAIGIGIGDASGMPGTGGVEGAVKGAVTAAGFMMNPMMALARAAFNVARGNAGGGNPSEGQDVGEDDSNAVPGNEAVTPANNPTAMGSDADAQENNPQGTSAPSGPSGPGPGAGPGTGANGGSNAGNDANPEASVSTGPGDTSSGGAGGDGGGASGDSVICTEMNRRGWLEDDIYKADEAFGSSLPAIIINGYHVWAVPLASRMRREDAVGNALARAAACFALPWAHEMAYRRAAAAQGHWLGTVLLCIGVPLCAAIGLFVKKETRNAVA